jgi:hypothetical protein
MDKKRQVLEKFGYGWQEFKTDSPIQKRTYYTPNGRALVLPADTYSLNHYLEKGFTLVPPKEELPTAGESSQTEGDNDQVRKAAQPKKTRRKKRKYRRSGKYAKGGNTGEKSKQEVEINGLPRFNESVV